MIWSDWHAVRSDGTIPSDLLPCEAFQLRWFLQWDYDIVQPERMFAQLTGKWRWRITDESGQLLFEQTNSVRVMVVWLYLGFSISMVSWHWDSSGDRITTTYPSPAPTVGNMAESLYLDPASNPTADFADPTVYIQTHYYGPLYAIVLPQGARISVPFHNVGATWLVKLANVGIRTAAAGGGDILVAEPGIIRLAGQERGHTQQRFSADGGLSWLQWRIPGGLGAPKLCRQPSGRLYCGGWDKRQYVLLQTHNDGFTWETVAVLWDAAYSDIDIASMADGTIVTVARRAGYYWCRTSRDGYVETYRVGAATQAMALSVDMQRQLLYLSDGLQRVYRSYDVGRSWEEVV